MQSPDKCLQVLSSKLIHCFIFCQIKLILSYLILSLEGPSNANFDPTHAIHNWYSAGIRKRRPDYAAVGRDTEVLEGIIEILHDEIVGDEMIQEEL